MLENEIFEDEDLGETDVRHLDDDVHVPVRWIIPSFPAIAATRGHGPIASYGESPDLIEEVTKVCRAFHREVTDDTVASDAPVYLFWQARSTGDWIVTQIVASPYAGNPRGTLDYHCLIFDSHTFHVLRYNPFRTHSLNLYAQLRSHVLAGRTDVFRCSIPRRYVPTSMPEREDSSLPGNANGIPGLSSGLPADANLRTLETYCYRWTSDPTPPPSFATFWGSDTAAPDCFDLVLRGPETVPVALLNAKKSLDRFVSQLKEAVAHVAPPADAAIAGLVNCVRSDIQEAEETLTEAIAAFGAGNQRQLQNDIMQASRHTERPKIRFELFAEEWASIEPIEGILPVAWLTQYSRELSTMIREISYRDATIWDPPPPPPILPRLIGTRLPKFVNPFANGRYSR